MTTAIEVHDLTVAYQRKPVLWDIDVSIPAGKLVAVVGPNGAGKSTLLKSILNLVPRMSGEISVFGNPVRAIRGSVGYVPQRESVDWDFPISAFEVVLMGRYGKLGWIRRPSKADTQEALRCLELVGMQDFGKRQISQLSGGQQQRIFLARALAQNASLYLMDEPFAGVDAATEQAIFAVLQQLRSDQKTIIAVHHDLQSVTQYFDWTVLLNVHLIAAGPTTEVFTSQNLQATYGGRLTILDRVGEALRHG